MVPFIFSISGDFPWVYTNHEEEEKEGVGVEKWKKYHLLLVVFGKRSQNHQTTDVT